MGWDFSRDDGDFPDLYRAAASFAETGARFHGGLEVAEGAASHALYRREVGAIWHGMLLRIGRASWDADAALGLARVREPGASPDPGATWGPEDGPGEAAEQPVALAQAQPAAPGPWRWFGPDSGGPCRLLGGPW